MSINVGQVATNLSDGERFYAYSGLLQGDVTNPATVTMVDVPNTGLKDSYLQVTPYFGLPVSTAGNEGLGIQIIIDDVIVYEFKSPDPYYRNILVPINLFVPRQSNLVILSLNTTGNNTQSRGCTVLGWRL